MNQATIIIFAKAPEPGKVKTRLTTELSQVQAAELHERLVLYTLEWISKVVNKFDHIKAELWCAPSKRHAFFAHCEQRFPVVLLEQQGDNLGDRMFHAIEQVLGHSKQAIIVGTDCPFLTEQNITDCIDQLNNGGECVITPAKDGGYVMLGANKIDAQLFTNITWGGDTVFTETSRRLNDLGWSWQTQKSLNDIDRPTDLALLEEITLPPTTSS